MCKKPPETFPFRINIYSRASITIPISWLYLISDVYVFFSSLALFILRMWVCMFAVSVFGICMRACMILRVTFEYFEEKRHTQTHTQKSQSKIIGLSIKLYLLSSWSSVYYFAGTINWWSCVYFSLNGSIVYKYIEFV